MATYLVTGAAGFIAARVCEMLLDNGHTVIGIDNLNDYYDVRLKDYRLGRLLGAASRGLGADPAKSVYREVGRIGGSPPPAGNRGAIGATRPAFEFRCLDIENLPALDALFAEYKFEGVFNLAARAGVRASLEHPELYHRTNVVGEENVLASQVKHGVNRHVLASSSSVYAGCPMPFTESAPLGKMQSPYAETKHRAELLAREYSERHELEVTVLRYFTVFGPAGRPDMSVLRFIKWIDEGSPIELFGDGTQARDFTYIDDIARGTLAAAQPRRIRSAFSRDPSSREAGATVHAGKTADGTSRESAAPDSPPGSPSSLGPPQSPRGFEVINLGGGRNPISIQAVIAYLEKALGKTARIAGKPSHVADMKETWADITKAETLLGWKPRVSPEDGFQRTVAWYRENKSWLREARL
ncbi:MAG TPA: NAD-dependent epimerase/dehydratase family protein [Lacunisphaera sp.]|jgi:nucleoside-diphosphate-sugar epimerase|nr:NAD-dependent epimerase/dehydratase family protein [Lacunisphaera sp.]